MSQRHMGLAAIFCFGAQLLNPAFPVGSHITFLAPILTASYYRLSLAGCLWLSCFAGCIADLLGDGVRLGVIPLSYCLTTYIVYRCRQRFFQGNLTTIPILSALFGFVVTALQAILLLPSRAIPSLNAQWLWIDWVIMPLQDGIWAYVCWALPAQISALRIRLALRSK